MSEHRVERVQMLAAVTALLRDAPYSFFITFKGLSVAKATVLRQRLAAKGARCRVFKNTYLRLGLDEAKVSLPPDFALRGDTALVSGSGDAVAVAKVIKEFGKENAPVTLKAGILNGRCLSAVQVLGLAELPPKEVLLAQLLMVLKSSATQLVRVLTVRRSSLVWLLENHAAKLAKT